MTYYRRANEAQRNDPELLAAVRAELDQQYAMMKLASEKLKEAKELLYAASGIEEDSLDSSSGLYEARLHVSQAISRFDFKIARPRIETYIGNAAALMSAEKAEALKEKYRIE